MNCKKCNTVIPAGSNTCPNCGETANSSIIIPTVDRPQIMPDGGIKNNSIPEMEPLIKHEDTNKVSEPKKENENLKSILNYVDSFKNEKTADTQIIYILTIGLFCGVMAYIAYYTKKSLDKIN